MKYCVVLLIVLTSACSTGKPPPQWPDGTERPINAKPMVQPAFPKGK